MRKRIAIRKKMGKPVFFTLTHCSKKLRGAANKFNYKANMHKLIFTDARFYNVKYQASIMTNCNFRGAKLIGVDFYNCNMRGVSFKGAIFEDVVFYNCNLKSAEFLGANFSNVVFICTNTEVAQNLDVNSAGITVLRTYKKLDLPNELESAMLRLSENHSIFEAKVLHVSKVKLNHWVLNIIITQYGTEGLNYLVKKLERKECWNNLYTVHSYLELLENALEK